MSRVATLTQESPRLSRAAQRAATAQQAARHLSAADPRMAALIARIGPHRPRISSNPFNTLLCSILQQQISMQVAAVFRARLLALCGGRFSPAAVLALKPRQLRAAGLSRQKALYVHDLAAHFADGRLTSRRLRKLDDEGVIQAVTQVHGIGRWTGEMLLMFCLERPDVWPIDDLGLRKAVGRFCGMSEMPRARDIRDLGDIWRPYRTYASWYFWRSLEGPLMPGVSA